MDQDIKEYIGYTTSVYLGWMVLIAIVLVGSAAFMGATQTGISGAIIGLLGGVATAAMVISWSAIPYLVAHK